MITVKPQTGKAEAEIKGLAVKMQNLRPMFVDFQSYMQRRTTLMFSRLSRGSGSFRGVSWPWFAPQYTRADGTVVPAFGGIPKLNGKGLVKGRKRASGKVDAVVLSGPAISPGQRAQSAYALALQIRSRG